MRADFHLLLATLTVGLLSGCAPVREAPTPAGSRAGQDRPRPRRRARAASPTSAHQGARAAGHRARTSWSAAAPAPWSALCIHPDSPDRNCKRRLWTWTKARSAIHPRLDLRVFKGEALQNFVKRAGAIPLLEKPLRTLGVVAKDLKSGESVVFRSGNTGMAVRASAAAPGAASRKTSMAASMSMAASVSLIPAKAARNLGANFTTVSTFR